MQPELYKFGGTRFFLITKNLGISVDGHYFPIWFSGYVLYKPTNEKFFTISSLACQQKFITQTQIIRMLNQHGINAEYRGRKVKISDEVIAYLMLKSIYGQQIS